MFQVFNSNPQPLHSGSKMHICGILLPPRAQVFVDDINGIRKSCKQWKNGEVHHKQVKCEDIEIVLSAKFPEVLTNRLV